MAKGLPSRHPGALALGAFFVFRAGATRYGSPKGFRAVGAERVERTKLCRPDGARLFSNLPRLTASHSLASAWARLFRASSTPARENRACRGPRSGAGLVDGFKYQCLCEQRPTPSAPRRFSAGCLLVFAPGNCVWNRYFVLDAGAKKW